MRERRTSIEMRKQQQQQSLRSSPQHMLTNSILIQTDDGRKYDSSIQYNRIIDNDQYTRHHHKSTKPVLGLCLVVSMFVILIMSEHFGFSSFPLVVTDSKYNYIRGNKPNIGNSYNSNSSSYSIDHGSINHEGGEYNSSDIIDALILADDDLDDELIGNDDDEEIQQNDSYDEENDIDKVDNQQKIKIQTNVTKKGDIIDLKDTDTDIIDEVVKATNQTIVVLKKVANNTMNEFQEVAANIVNELIAEEGIDNVDIGVHKTNATGESSPKQNISDSVSYNDTLNIDDEQSEGSYDTSTRVYTGADDYQRTDINEDESGEHEDNIDYETDDLKDENNQYQKVESVKVVTDQHDNYRYAAAPNYDDDNT